MNTVLDESARPGCGLAGCLLWFLGGLTLSVTTISALVLLLFLIVSVALNVYLAWQVSGLEITISQRTPVFTDLVIPTGLPITFNMATPEAELAGTPTPAPAATQVEQQVATIVAIVTNAAEAAPTPTPTATSASAATPTVVVAPAVTTPPQDESTVLEKMDVPAEESPVPPETASDTEATTSVPVDTESLPLAASAARHTYSLIPIEGERESRPADEHGDLNLKLRDPQPIEAELAVVDAGVGVDPDAPKLSKIFEPGFSGAYTVHEWDWGCNCKGELIEDKTVVIVTIKTTPGEPVFIPPRNQDIYDGKYYAVVLYASEDSLTFVYSRAGNVVKGYTVHYVGLKTDPDLLALFRESQGSQLPGLSLDTPVGTATGELLVAIRDNGKFLDARSKNDWWD